MTSFIVSTLMLLGMLTFPLLAKSETLEMSRIDNLITKHNLIIEKPKSCPLESKKFSELIVKMEAIKEVLKGNCASKDKDRMSEVLASIKELQDDLRNRSVVTNTDAMNDLLGDFSFGDSDSTSSLSGLKFSALFSNITTMFKKNQCNLEDGRVLQMTADLIYDSTQLGVLAGNQLGLLVAGGGFLVSSAMRLMDLILKQKFDFKKNSDRQTFITLNCSFYEIRRELDANGVMDIENASTRDDLKETKELSEKLISRIKEIDHEKNAISHSNNDIDKNSLKTELGDLSNLKKSLLNTQEILTPGIDFNSSIPADTQKMLLMTKIAQNYNQLILDLTKYKELKISRIPMLDDLLIVDLKKFDPFDSQSLLASLNMPAKEFNENLRASILFHILRIQEDVKVKEDIIIQNNEAIKNKLAISLESQKEILVKKMLELKKVELKLLKLVSPKKFSGLDDGSDNLITIINDYNEISSQIYGVWGEKFLKYSTQRSLEEVKSFNERYKNFEEKYISIISSDEPKQLATSYLCQDAQKLRVMYKYSDSLVQSGYDFIVTNKDIIYSDAKNAYNLKMNEETSFDAFMGEIQKMQRHHRSVLYALRILNGDEVSEKDKEQYLDKKVFTSAYLGRSMLEVNTVKDKAIYVQDIYEKFNCRKNLVEDLTI